MSEGKTEQMLLAICTGCGIGDCIQTGQLSDVAKEAVDGICCIDHPALCSEEGLRQINKAIDDRGAQRVAVAACSPRVKTGEFSFPGIHLERINLREQVAWVMEPGSEDTRMCAEDLVRMALARLSSIKTAAPYVPDPLQRSILVLGGGVSGLTASLEGARAGYTVELVEKGPVLGGYAGRIHKMLPAAEAGQGMSEPDVQHLAAQVQEHPGVRVWLDTTLESLAGEPGQFQGYPEQRQTDNAAGRCRCTGYRLEAL